MTRGMVSSIKVFFRPPELPILIAVVVLKGRWEFGSRRRNGQTGSDR